MSKYPEQQLNLPQCLIQSFLYKQNIMNHYIYNSLPTSFQQSLVNNIKLHIYSGHETKQLVCVNCELLLS